MANQTRTIRIESILGGHSPTTHFAAPDQFQASIGIDPSVPTYSYGDGTGAGILSPTSCQKITGDTLNGPIALSGGNLNFARTPLWIKNQPKTSTVFVYDAAGSVYTLGSSSITGLKDLYDTSSGEPRGSRGGGCAYYDNYMYFARSTTVARYGPLNGTPSWTTDYWGNTLGKTALVDIDYPSDNEAGLDYPNHVMHRHSDGRLYFVDVVDNAGTIHYIKTTKTSVEGDTDGGSKYNALQVGYGLWPTAMESYGSDLVIAFSEAQNNATTSQLRAKIAFWDTNSQSVNKITWVEFPDAIVSALKNVNGVLYVFSGNSVANGFRVSRFVGGYTFEEVYFSEDGQTPLAGAVDGTSVRLFFGSATSLPVDSACLYSYGLQKASLGSGVFCISGATGSTNGQAVSSIYVSPRQFSEPSINIGWTDGINGGYTAGVDKALALSSQYGNTKTAWLSKTFRIGQPFKITKIRIPLAQALSSTKSVVPKIYFDDGVGSSTLVTINSTNFGTNRKSIVIRPENLTADNDFFLELTWTGTSFCAISLPITIEYELLDVDSAYP